MTVSNGPVDVTVVGAGPAGVATAITLARAGASVVLADRARFPRDKSCGDGLTTGALRRLDELGLDPSNVASFRALPEIALHSPSGRTLVLPFRDGPGIFAATARRFDLDRALVDVARDAGVTVLEDARCTGVTSQRNGLVTCAFAELKETNSRYVVGADGAWSEVRKLTSPRPTGQAPARPDWIAFRAYVNGARHEASERLWVWFPPELLPGYAWSFPLGDGSLNVGIAAPASSGRELAGAWRKAVSSPFLESLVGSDAAIESPARAWPIPTALEIDALSSLEGRVLFVGDAARAADPFTGEGIGQALETGVLAAEAIIDGGASPSAVADRYRRSIAHTVGRDHSLARWCRRLFAHNLGARGALRIVDAGPFTRPNVARWLFEDYSRTAIATLSSWPSAFRRRNGAFASDTSFR